MIKTFMTVPEFVKAYASGLESSLSQSFKNGQPAHLEDLMAWTTTYTETAFEFLTSMPTQPRLITQKEEECPPTSTNAPVDEEKK